MSMVCPCVFVKYFNGEENSKKMFLCSFNIDCFNIYYRQKANTKDLL